MTYSKEKANKLKAEFAYIIGKPYFPYGDEGKEFKISNLEVSLLKRKPINEFHDETSNPKKFENGENWRVVVVIEQKGESKIEKDLEDVLKRLKIKHDIKDVK